MNDGGPAFPTLSPDIASCTLGMSRRQWLAGLAMQGFIRDDRPPIYDIPRLSYELADQMIAYEEKEKK